MGSKHVFKLLQKNTFYMSIRQYANANRLHPFTKTWRVLANSVPSKALDNKRSVVVPEHADVVVIGGGTLGASIAYWLKKQCGHGLSVIVLDKDFTYKSSLKNLSFHGITQNYSILENILMSQFSAEFFRCIKHYLGDKVDLNYTPYRRLILANAHNVASLEQSVEEQQEHGVKNELLTPEKIKEKFPWMNVEDIKLGCIGLENEGWINPCALHAGLIAKSQELGAIYINGEVIDMELVLQQDILMEGVKPATYKKIDKVIYKFDDEDETREIKFAICILASGVTSAEVAKFAKIGIGEDMLSVALPIETRQNKIFCIESNKSHNLGINKPFTKDTNGVWIRRNGLDNSFVCGYTPEVYNKSLEDMPHEELFKNIIEPSLRHRIPDLNDIKVTSSNTEIYDCNSYDESGILGPHPYHTNLILATGFGNQGIELAPAIGRAVSELIVDQRYSSIDLTRFEFDRLFTDSPLIELNNY